MVNSQLSEVIFKEKIGLSSFILDDFYSVLCLIFYSCFEYIEDYFK